MCDATFINIDIEQYVSVIVIASSGGIAAFIQKVRDGKTRLLNLSELIGDLFIASFTGIVVFWGCVDLEISPVRTAIVIAIAGHMGNKAIFLLEKIIIYLVDKYLKKYITKSENGN